MPHFKTKPAIVEAVQFNAPGDHHAVIPFSMMKPDPTEYPAGFTRRAGIEEIRYFVSGPQGVVEVMIGDYIVAAPIVGQFYPVSPMIFEAMFEAI